LWKATGTATGELSRHVVEEILPEPKCQLARVLYFGGADG